MSKIWQKNLSEQCYHDDAREKARGSKHHQNRKSRTTKISSLRVDKIDISFPEKIFNAFDTKETSIPIGHYTNYAIEPTCGLATIHDFIGKVDEPRYFMDPRRMDARILWFTSGFVEYQAPNFLNTEDTLEMLEVSVEISSEFPFQMTIGLQISLSA